MGTDGAVIQLVTRCNSVEEFIERFARFTTETDVVVPALPHVTVGTDGHFVIRLKDRSVMMKGRCEVTEIRPVDVAPGAAPAPAPAPARALMRLRLREMDAHSAGIHLRLMERHAATAKPPVPPPPAPRPVARALTLVPPLREVPAPVPPPPAPPPASTMQVMSVPGARSLRSSAAPLPVAPAGPQAAAAVASATPAPVTGEIAPLARAETRVPGAAFTLPANPLSDLDAADLAGFIELTLLETNGAAGAAPLAGGEALGGGATVQAAAEAAGAALPARQETRLERAQRIGRRVAPYAACVLVGLWLGVTFRPSAKVAVMVGAPAVVPPPEGEPMPPAAPAAATAAERDCVARVTTTPKGAQVLWGDIALGTSPLAHAAIPCGGGTLTFRRERYAELTRKISAERGQDTVVDERMTRPPAKLIVTSSPPNALIKVNRSRFGQAPRKINTQRYEHLHLQASLPGYRPWKKTVYLKDAETKVDVELAPIAKPSVRRAAAPAAAPARPAPPPAAPARAATPPVAKGAPLKPSAR